MADPSSTDAPPPSRSVPPPSPSADGMPPAVWVSTTYFAEGFPYSVVNNVADILWKDLGASYGAIGLTSLFHLPWNLKLLWGPWVDRYETKRWWLVLTELSLCALMAGLVLASVLGGPSWLLLTLLFVAMAVASATHDIAIDGYYLEALDERGQSTYVGLRAPAYKVATLVFGPLIVLKDFTGWFVAFAVVLGVMVALTVLHAFALPTADRRKQPISALLRRLTSGYALAGVAAVALTVAGAVWWADVPAMETEQLARFGKAVGQWFAVAMVVVLFGLLAALRPIRRLVERRAARAETKEDSRAGGYAQAFLTFLEQPRVVVILLFVIFFRTGESFLLKMKFPFMRDVMHMTDAQYGYANLIFGVLATFAGTALGGWLISRHGLRRWIWPFVIAQNVLNLIFMGLAAGGTSPGFWGLAGVICVEQFGAGLGTAVFMVYLMRCCHAEHRAAHMAILTALMSVSFTIAGTVSGFLVEGLGFARFFGITFLATLPGMLLIPFLPHLDREPAAGA